MSDSSPRLPTTLQDIGRQGEELAAAFLIQSGFQIVAANFTLPVGRNRNDAVVSVEIDLVAYEGPTLCFVEVKTRTSDWFAAPSASVDLRKQRQIIRAAQAYRRLFGLIEEPYRFDVVGIVLPADDEGPRALRIELLRDFWSADKFRKRAWVERYYD